MLHKTNTMISLTNNATSRTVTSITGLQRFFISALAQVIGTLYMEV